MQTVQKLSVQYKGTHDALFKPIKTHDSVNNAFRGIEYASAVEVHRSSHSALHLSAVWLSVVSFATLVVILIGG